MKPSYQQLLEELNQIKEENKNLIKTIDQKNIQIDNYLTDKKPSH